MGQGLVHSAAAARATVGDGRASRARRLLAAAALVLLALLCGVCQAAADDAAHELQLEVFIDDVSTQKIATFMQDANQQLSATRRELADVGVKAPGTGADDDKVVITGAPGIAYRYDEASQRIYFTLGDDLRVRQVYDARPTPEHAIPPRPDFGAAINYNLFGGATKAFGPGFTGFSGANASLDARAFGPLGTLTQTGILGSTTLRDIDALRLETTWTYSDPQNLVSYRAGDTISGGLAWTRPVRLGGLQTQRNFGLRPDLVTLPLPSFSGSAAVPSTVDVYVNSVKALSQPVAAGPYQITNLPLLAGGGDARLVVQDAAGHQIETSLPYFTSPILLREGLTYFSAEAGLPRLAYATDSNDYLLKPAASASVRHGLYDWLTLEAHGEGGVGGLMNAGAGLAVQLKSWGVLSLAGSASSFEERFGFQGYAAFDTQLFGITLHAGTQRTFGPYTDLSSAISRYVPTQPTALGGLLQTVAPSTSALPPHALDTFSLGFPLPFDNSNLSLGFIHLDQPGQSPSEILSVSYSRPLFADATFHITAFTDLANRGSNGIFAGLSIPLNASTSASTGVSRGSGGTAYTSEVAKTMQPEPGSYGWRVRDSEGSSPYRSADASYRSSVGQVQGEVQQYDKTVGGTLQADGAVAVMGGGVFFANRINDAFAVVDAGLPNIEVLYENRPAGKTNSDGKILLPELRSYQKNQVAIDPRDLPLNAEAASTQDVIAPADRAGVVVRFGAKNDNDTAMVKLVDKTNNPIPVGSSVHLDTSKEDGVVGYDGETFLKGLGASNTVVVTTEAGECRATFPFTAEKDTQVVIGPVVCQ